MVGYIDIPLGRETHRATLADRGGYWECPTSRELEKQLNLEFGVVDYSPADGAYGARQLNAAADHFGTRAVFEPKEPAPPGTVY